MTTPKKVKVHSMVWYVRKVDALKTFSLAMERHLLKDTAKYPIRRTVLKTIHIESGRSDLGETCLFMGQIPRRLVLAFVNNNAFVGFVRANPFNFQTFSLRRITVVAGGVSFPRNRMTYDFSEKNYTLAYMNMFENLNMSSTDKLNGISYEDFANGYCFLPFNLTSDGSDGGHLELVKEGTTSVSADFQLPLPNAIKLICYAEFDNIIEIDQFRNITSDFSL
jgi:hypothetical protein